MQQDTKSKLEEISRLQGVIREAEEQIEALIGSKKVDKKKRERTHQRYPKRGDLLVQEIIPEIKKEEFASGDISSLLKSTRGIDMPISSAGTYLSLLVKQNVLRAMGRSAHGSMKYARVS